MTTAAITQKPIMPFEIRRDPCPLVRKTTTVFFICLGTVTLGVSLTLSYATIVVIGGGAIGLVAGLILARHLIQKELPPLQEYRLETLQKIGNDQGQLLPLITKVTSVFSQKVIQFHWAAEHHALHDALTQITLSPSMKERKGLAEIWKQFLENVKGLEVTYPQGPKHHLDCSMEIERLEGKNIALKAELLKSPSQEDLEKIKNLEIDIDGWAHSELSPNQCIVVRREQEILGILLFKIENAGNIYISYLGRDSRAARLGIGELLLDKLKSMGLTKQITLHVRSKNENAIKLYRKKGFEQISIEKEWTYTFPNDTPILMGFNTH